MHDRETFSEMLTGQGAKAEQQSTAASPHTQSTNFPVLMACAV